MKNGQCPKCDGKNILGNVGILDGVHGGIAPTTSLGVMKKPNALVFKQMVSSEVQAWVCEDGGFTEFYTIDPACLGNAIDQAESPSFLARVSPFRVK